MMWRSENRWRSFSTSRASSDQSSPPRLLKNLITTRRPLLLSTARQASPKAPLPRNASCSYPGTWSGGSSLSTLSSRASRSSSGPITRVASLMFVMLATQIVGGGVPGRQRPGAPPFSASHIPDHRTIGGSPQGHTAGARTVRRLHEKTGILTYKTGILTYPDKLNIVGSLLATGRSCPAMIALTVSNQSG